MTTTQETGREYLRVSQDRSGRARSVEEQHDDNIRAGEAHGFTINGESYSDPSLSASRYATKVRGDFARLLDDLRAGQFGADLLVLWESSRGSRRVGEWATLVDTLEDAGVKVHVTMHNRTYDPANHRDRRSLMEDAVDAEYSSGKSSDAIRRAAKASAERGEPHGRTPFGYTRRYDPQTRRLAAQEADPAEAPIVREIYSRLHQGHSLSGIARDFAGRRVTTRSGTAWTAANLRELALRPVYAGLRLHSPGTRSGRHKGTLDGVTVKATWPALVDAEVYHAVRALLLDPARETWRPGRGVHLLSMIARCDVCGSVLVASYRRGARRYECRKKACVRIGADDLDTYAERAILSYLARDDVIAALRTVPDDSGELAQVRADLAAARTELADWRRLAKERKVTAASFAEIEPGLVTGIGRLEARETELTTPSALLVIPPGKDAARRWAAAEMPARRQVARLLLSRQVIGELRVTRTPKPGSKPVDAADRVVWLREE
jgi:DNA invertase Pin-like site-specific DNA recombinase